MKILTLNKKQEKLLIQMCKEFFPEWKTWNKIGIDSSSTQNIIFYDKYGYDDGADIAWYQLCLTELPKRIFDKLEKEKYQIISRVLEEIDGFDYWQPYYSMNMDRLLIINILESKNPIQFLYNFIEECKKNNYFKSK